MKEIAIFATIVTLLLSSCSNKNTTGNCITPDKFVSFWDGFDFKDKSMVNNIGVTEEKFKAFCSIIAMESNEEREQQIDTLLARSEDGSKEMFLGFMDLAEKYLDDANSPMRNEESYIPFLQYATSKAKIENSYKERYNYQLKVALMNRVGTKANDFKYITREGYSGTLYKTTGKYILLYFNNPDCHDCKRVYDIIKSSAALAHLVATGDLAILALYPDEDMAAWEKYKENYPYTWVVAHFSTAKDRDSYNLPAIPCIYLLDKNRKVIYKDAPIEQVEDYLVRKEM